MVPPMATQPRIATPGSDGPSWLAIWLLAFALARPWPGLRWPSSTSGCWRRDTAHLRSLPGSGAARVVRVGGLHRWCFRSGSASAGAAAVGRRGTLSSGVRHGGGPGRPRPGNRDQPAVRTHGELRGSGILGRLSQDRAALLPLLLHHLLGDRRRGSCGRYYRSSRDREVEASQLQAELTQAQLATLRMQLQPHFLFNTLHTIASLVRDGRGEAATTTIARLGELFRQTLGNVQRNEVPLREELSFIEAYLEIEQTRFSDRLAVRFDVDRETLERRSPTCRSSRWWRMPFVTGSRAIPVRAGSRSGRRRTMRYGSRCATRTRISGNGASGGVGLANTRARLAGCMARLPAGARAGSVGRDPRGARSPLAGERGAGVSPDPGADRGRRAGGAAYDSAAAGRRFGFPGTRRVL